MTIYYPGCDNLFVIEVSEVSTILSTLQFCISTLYQPCQFSPTITNSFTQAIQIEIKFSLISFITKEEIKVIWDVLFVYEYLVNGTNTEYFSEKPRIFYKPLNPSRNEVMAIKIF